MSYEGRGLGFRHIEDSRDKNFLMRTQLDPLLAQYFPRGLPPGTRHYRSGPVLDQGNTGTCVAHGWAAWSQGAPLMVKPTPALEPMHLYDEIVKIDEWADNDNDIERQFGTSVRAGAKYLQSKGYIKNYYWAESAEDVRAWHLAGFGTCVLGTVWKSNMWETGSGDILQVSGWDEGGHAYKSSGWNDSVGPKGAVRIQNSWGYKWSTNGHAWILYDDLDTLIHEDGEVCAAIEQRLV